MRAAVQGAFHGHEGMRKFFRDNQENFESFHVSAPSFVTSGIAWSLLAPASARRQRGEAEVPSALVRADFREGKIVRFEEAGRRAHGDDVAGARITAPGRSRGSQPAPRPKRS